MKLTYEKCEWVWRRKASICHADHGAVDCGLAALGDATFSDRSAIILPSVFGGVWSADYFRYLKLRTKLLELLMIVARAVGRDAGIKASLAAKAELESDWPLRRA